MMGRLVSLQTTLPMQRPRGNEHEANYLLSHLTLTQKAPANRGSKASRPRYTVGFNGTSWDPTTMGVSWHLLGSDLPWVRYPPNGSVPVDFLEPTLKGYGPPRPHDVLRAAGA